MKKKILVLRSTPVEESEPRASEVSVLRDALERSVRFQSHYAKLLNMWDGGERLIFEDADQWLARLKHVDNEFKRARLGLPGAQRRRT